jgi:hypothetical protein
MPATTDAAKYNRIYAALTWSGRPEYLVQQ